MPSELSIDLQDYLKLCGLPQHKLSRCSGETRMYHDLGIYGDVAEAYLEVLAEHYQVDLGDFEFEKFFPYEHEGTTTFARLIFWILPFAGSAARKQKEYAPLTLERIDRAIYSKRWG